MPSTGKGFPYPSSSDNPNIPADFQALAEAIDAELDSYSTTDANTTYHFEGTQHDTDDVDLELVGSNGVTDVVHFKAGPGVDITWDEINQRVTIGIEADLAAIEALTGTSGFLKKTAANTWELDTNTYSTTSHSHTLDGLSDVVITSATTGQVLKFDGTNWINGTDETGAGGSGNSFTTIVPSSGNNVVADSSTDTLTLTGGTGISVTGDATTDTITIAVSGSYITGSSPTISTPTLTLSTTTSTTDGRIAWDATNDKLIVGDGTTAREFASSTLVQNAQTGTTYTPVLADKDKLVELSNASAITLTVPTNTSVTYPVGTQINLLQTGAGQVTVVGDAGVTVNATPGLKLRAQWSSATLIKRATNTWVLIGDLSA
jgi:hypothetical protein